MATQTFTYTHKGWSGFCPVHIADPYSECPAVDARHPLLEWLFDVSDFCEQSVIYIRSFFDPTYEPAFTLRITGELKTPVVKTFEV